MKGQAAHQHGHIAVNGVRTRLLRAHAVERQVQLFGHQHGQRRVHALAHFAARHGQHHGAIGGDLDPAIEGHVALCGKHQTL